MKTLKRFLCVLSAVVCSTFFYSCQEITDKALQLGIEQAKKDFPVVIDEGMIADDITLGDNGIVYHVTVDEEIYDMDVLKTVTSDIKEGIIEGLKGSIYDDHDIKDFLSAAVEYNKPLNYKYEGNISGSIVRVKLSVSDIKDILGQ